MASTSNRNRWLPEAIDGHRFSICTVLKIFLSVVGIIMLCTILFYSLVYPHAGNIDYLSSLLLFTTTTTYCAPTVAVVHTLSYPTPHPRHLSLSSPLCLLQPAVHLLLPLVSLSFLSTTASVLHPRFSSYSPSSQFRHHVFRGVQRYSRLFD